LPLPSSPHCVPITMTNLPMTLPNQKENPETDQHAPQARDAQLPIAHVEQMSERALHAARVQKGRHALKHQEKRDRGDEIPTGGAWGD